MEGNGRASLSLSAYYSLIGVRKERRRSPRVAPPSVKIYTIDAQKQRQKREQQPTVKQNKNTMNGENVAINHAHLSSMGGVK
jgi:hypothetical protein